MSHASLHPEGTQEPTTAASTNPTTTTTPSLNRALQHLTNALACSRCRLVKDRIRIYVECGHVVCASCRDAAAALTETTPTKGDTQQQTPPQCAICHNSSPRVDLSEILERNMTAVTQKLSCTTTSFPTADPYLLWATLEALVNEHTSVIGSRVQPLTAPPPNSAVVYHRGGRPGRVGRHSWERSAARPLQPSQPQEPPTPETTTTTQNPTTHTPDELSFPSSSQSQSQSQSPSSSRSLEDSQQRQSPSLSSDNSALVETSDPTTPFDTTTDAHTASPRSAVANTTSGTPFVGPLPTPAIQESSTRVSFVRHDNTSAAATPPTVPPTTDTHLATIGNDPTHRLVPAARRVTPGSTLHQRYYPQEKHSWDIKTSTTEENGSPIIDTDRMTASHESPLVDTERPNQVLGTPNYDSLSQTSIQSDLLPQTEQMEALLVAPADASPPIPHADDDDDMPPPRSRISERVETPHIHRHWREDMSQEHSSSSPLSSQQSIQSHLLPQTEQMEALLQVDPSPTSTNATSPSSPFRAPPSPLNMPPPCLEKQEDMPLIRLSCKEKEDASSPARTETPPTSHSRSHPEESSAPSSEESILSQQLPSTCDFQALLAENHGNETNENLWKGTRNSMGLKIPTSAVAHTNAPLTLTTTPREPASTLDSQSFQSETQVDESIGSEILPSELDFQTLLSGKSKKIRRRHGESDSGSQVTLDERSRPGSQSQVDSQLLPQTCDFENMLQDDPCPLPPQDSVNLSADDCPCILYDPNISDSDFELLGRLQDAGQCKVVRYLQEETENSPAQSLNVAHPTHFVTDCILQDDPFHGSVDNDVAPGVTLPKISVCLPSYEYLCAVALGLRIVSPEWISSYQDSRKLPNEATCSIWGDQSTYETIRNLLNGSGAKDTWPRNVDWFQKQVAPLRSPMPPILKNVSILVLPVLDASINQSNDLCTGPILDSFAPRTTGLRHRSISFQHLTKAKIETLGRLCGAHIVSCPGELEKAETAQKIVILTSTISREDADASRDLVRQVCSSGEPVTVHSSWLTDSIRFGTLAPVYDYQYEQRS